VARRDRPGGKRPASAPQSPRPARGRAAARNASRATAALAPEPAERSPGLPTRPELASFLADQPGKVGRRDIIRAFNLGPDDRQGLRRLLRELEAEGEATREHGRRVTAPGRTLETAVVEVFGTDLDGDPLARPLGWEGADAPLILMAPEKAGQPGLAPGDRVLAKLRPISPGKFEGRTIRRVTETPARILGVFHPRGAAGGFLEPTNRREKREWQVPPGSTGGAEPGELVLAEPLPGRPLGPRPVRVVERIGPVDAPRAVSLIAIHTHGIPDTFPAEAVQEAEAASEATLQGREDLRQVPLVTIDGEDARDFDDAVWAEPIEGGGHRLLVAIADVAWYVRPGSALDHDARRRGNSVYFPDRVVPMLPEALSNGWCSLKPRENRGCLAIELEIDANGRKTKHRVLRGLMRSAARLTYEQVEAARAQGNTPDGVPPDLIPALYAAHAALETARAARGTLDLDLPERRVLLDAEGRVTGVVPRARLTSHRLIEEFMIAANVAAAEELERLHAPCVYRIHDRPSPEKLQDLRGFLDGLGLGLASAGEIRPSSFAKLLEAVQGRPDARIVSEVILRSQAQAAYDTENIGHFGLALSRYAHFTSPIRRYADLLVHRALIRGLVLGEGGLGANEGAGLAEAAAQATRCERRAVGAERDAADRYLALYLGERVGSRFPATISGVTRFGLFVTLEETGASGLIPLRALGEDFWNHEERSQTLVGRSSGVTWRLAEPIEVILVEANPNTGGLLFRPAGPDRSRSDQPGGDSKLDRWRDPGDRPATRHRPPRGHF